MNQSNTTAEFLDGGIGWGTLDTVTVTGGELVVTLTGGPHTSSRGRLNWEGPPNDPTTRV